MNKFNWIKYVSFVLFSSCGTDGGSAKTCVWADSTCVTRNLSIADGSTGSNLELSYQNIDPNAPLRLSGEVAITAMTAILNLAPDSTPKPFQFRWTAKQVRSRLDLCISLRNATVQVCMVLPVTPASDHGLASLLISNNGTLAPSSTQNQIKHQMEGDSSTNDLSTVGAGVPGEAGGRTGVSPTDSKPELETTENPPDDDSDVVVTVAAEVVSEREAIEKIDPSLSTKLHSALDQAYNRTNQSLHALGDITGGALAVSAAVGQRTGSTEQKSSAVSGFLSICQRAMNDPIISATPESTKAAIKTIASVLPETLKGLIPSIGLKSALTKLDDAGTIIINQILAKQTPVPSAIVSILTPPSGGAGGGGSSNTPWGTTGIVKNAVSSGDDYGNAVAIQSDGKVVIAGSSNGDILVIRYNANGSLDTTFDGDGMVTKDISSGDDSANAIAIQSDGKILVAGSAYHGSNQHLVIVRYNTNGSLDTSFATAGIYDYSLTGDNQLNGILLQTDGKIVVGGTVGGKFFLARLASTGSLDSSFGTSGVVNAALGSSTADDLKAFALQSDGKFVAVGSTTVSSQFDSAIVRYTSAGALDTSFDTDGIVTVDASGASEEDAIVSVALNSDNTRILVGGYKKPSDKDAILLLYDSSGSAVSGFGTSGKVTFGTSGTSNDDQVYAVKFTSDGYILAAGQVYNSTDTSSDSFVRKYDTSGSLVTSFGTSGITITNVDSKDNYSIGMALQSDGKIVLAGIVGTGSNNNDVVTIRLKSNGTLDAQ